MTTTQVIAVFGIVLSAATALVVAYLQRKQMRQVELYKQDPSAGLIPPESKLTRFIKSKWDTLFAYGGPIYILVTEVTRDAPVTRFSVLMISLALTMLALNLMLSLLFRVFSRLNERIAKLQEFNDRQLQITGKIVDDLYQPNVRK